MLDSSYCRAVLLGVVYNEIIPNAIQEDTVSTDLPGRNATPILYAITCYELIFTLKATYKSQIQNRGKGKGMA
jgi:hypothetical protein